MNFTKYTKMSLLLYCFPIWLYGEDRFPRPDFESNYIYPQKDNPLSSWFIWEYIDIFLLILLLCLASYCAIKKRSRKGLFFIALFTVIYFGFIKNGCICAVGSLQNITLALSNTNYIISISVILIFLLPLIFTLLFGRTFCSSVCPLGAIQELLIFKPIKIPSTLKEILSIIPVIYLAFSVLFASLGAGFIICKYDPFIALFRLNGNINMILFATIMLLLGLFIARPYCRFLCPYGVLLGWMSKLSIYHLSITPDECTQCKLCADACPFDAIDAPVTNEIKELKNSGIKRIFIMIIFIPVLMFLCGFFISNLNIPISKMHSTVQLAEQIKLEDLGYTTMTTLESQTFRITGKTSSKLFEEAIGIRNNFKIGGWYVGVFIGLIIGLKLLSLSILKQRKDYTPNTGECFSCGRCFASCPKHIKTQEFIEVKNIE